MIKKINAIKNLFFLFFLYIEMLETTMLEITKKNWYKSNLETVINNNSQHFWINLRDYEVETESKWLNIFNNHGNKSTLKYRKELTPNYKFQANRIFVRNDLFEKVIKSYKATNTEFLTLKIDEEPIEEIVEVSNKKSTKKLTKELIEESDNESAKNQIINRIKNQIMNRIKNQIMNRIKNQIMNQLKK